MLAAFFRALVPGSGLGPFSVPAVLALSIAYSLVARSSAADEADPPGAANAASDDSEAGADDDDFGHGRQFALRAALVAGYRMVFRYDDSPYCREYDVAKAPDDQAKFCGHGAPLAIDLGFSFAPLDFIEPYLWARFGVAKEDETQTDPVVIIGAGARIYTMSDSAFKIYVEPAVGLELEKGMFTEVGYDRDFVVHVAAGPQLDVSKNFGLFVDGGMTLGILRSLHSSLELKAGVQARLP